MVLGIDFFFDIMAFSSLKRDLIFLRAVYAPVLTLQYISKKLPGHDLRRFRRVPRGRAIDNENVAFQNRHDLWLTICQIWYIIEMHGR